MIEKANQPILDHLTESRGKLPASQHLQPQLSALLAGAKSRLYLEPLSNGLHLSTASGKEALKAIDSVKWIPESGRSRIFNMVEKPLGLVHQPPAMPGEFQFRYSIAKKDHKPLMTAESIERVATAFEKYGSDAWLGKNTQRVDWRSKM